MRTDASEPVLFEKKEGSGIIAESPTVGIVQEDQREARPRSRFEEIDGTTGDIES